MDIQQLSDIAEAIELDEEDFERLNAAVKEMELIFMREDENRKISSFHLNKGYGHGC